MATATAVAVFKVFLKFSLPSKKQSTDIFYFRSQIADCILLEAKKIALVWS